MQVFLIKTIKLLYEKLGDKHFPLIVMHFLMVHAAVPSNAELTHKTVHHQHTV